MKLQRHVYCYTNKQEKFLGFVLDELTLCTKFCWEQQTEHCVRFFDLPWKFLLLVYKAYKMSDRENAERKKEDTLYSSGLLLSDDQVTEGLEGTLWLYAM